MRRVHHTVMANGLEHYVSETLPDGPTKRTVLLLHGFPDDHTLWDGLSALLVSEGYRVIAPDMRGYGQTGIAENLASYDILAGPSADVLTILDHFDCENIHLVGHDFGAVTAWQLVGRHPERFETFTALSVGHQRSVLKRKTTFEQIRMSNHMITHQFTGLIEWAYRRNDWSRCRKFLATHYDLEDVISKISRPGRLTAALNWYRANIGFKRIFKNPPEGAFGNELIPIPTLGIWSSGDRFIPEAQMKGSGEFVTGHWEYERLEGFSHWFPATASDYLAKRLIEFWDI